MIEFNPLQKEKLFVHQVIQDWCPTLLGKLDDIRTALKAKSDGNVELTKNLETLDMVQKTFLFAGCQDYYNKLVPIPVED